VQITTSKGTLTFELYPDQAPITVANFTNKISSGFYHNLTFHRVEDWVIQGGDPEGTGQGGGDLVTELNQLPFSQGSLGVARGDDIKVSNDSQFFICLKDCLWLNGQYTNFGRLVEGLDVAKLITPGDAILTTKLQ
jgi:cyclophilin family peptidyl-prolyl cis-trans isomerase